MNDTEEIQIFLKNKISEIDCMLTHQTYLKSIEKLDYNDIKYIGTYNYDPEEGFVYSKDKNIRDIMEKIYTNYDKHSGASMGFTLHWINQMYKEYITMNV